MQKSSRQNLSGELAEAIRVMISEGQLAADARINEVRLAEELGVSRTPLREALATLVAEGALESRPRRGVFVRPLTRADFMALYAVRPLLDVGALRLAGLPSRRVLDRLRSLNERMHSTDNALKRIKLDDEWHVLLVQACDNCVLIDLIRQFMLRTRRYELAYLGDVTHVQTAVDEHLEILTALENRDLEAACRSLDKNLRSGIAPILSWLDQRESHL